MAEVLKYQYLIPLTLAYLQPARLTSALVEFVLFQSFVTYCNVRPLKYPADQTRPAGQGEKLMSVFPTVFYSPRTTVQEALASSDSLDIKPRRLFYFR